MSVFDILIFSASILLTLVGCALVVFSRNLVHACFYLFCCLLGVAGLYVCLSADLLAAIQLVVYVGGVVILILFAVMLTGGNKVGEFLPKLGLKSVPYMGNMGTFLTGFLTVIVIFASIIKMILSSISRFNAEVSGNFSSTVSSVGRSLLGDHILAFELSAVLLVGALIGAAVISRPSTTNIEVEK